MRKILITGATGKVGSEFISLLSSTKEDWQVVIDTRNPKSQKVEFLGNLSRHPITPITLGGGSSEQKALSGLTDIFVIAQVSENMANWHHQLIDTIGRYASSPNIVKVSVTGAKNPIENPETGMVPGQHWLGEQIIRDTEWPNVCIRPNIFMQHFMMNTGLYIARDDKFYLPFSSTGVSWLDCTDIALCAYHLFSDEQKFKAYHSKAFELSGQTSITPEEMQEVLSNFLGKSVQHYSSIEDFEKRCSSLGISDWAKHFYQEASGGWFSTVHTEDFKQITGQSPKNFAQFILANQYWFKKN
jgi:uncharacterized protein YbjT (DUF2867 family)